MRENELPYWDGVRARLPLLRSIRAILETPLISLVIEHGGFVQNKFVSALLVNRDGQVETNLGTGKVLTCRHGCAQEQHGQPCDTLEGQKGLAIGVLIGRLGGPGLHSGHHRFDSSLPHDDPQLQRYFLWVFGCEYSPRTAVAGVQYHEGKSRCFEEGFYKEGPITPSFDGRPIIYSLGTTNEYSEAWSYDLDDG